MSLLGTIVALSYLECMFKSNTITHIDLRYSDHVQGGNTSLSFSCLPNFRYLYLNPFGSPPPDPDAHIAVFRTCLQNCTNLLYLDLSGNLLGELWSGMFHGLHSLHTLLMNDNRLDHWPTDTFYKLPNLIHLSLQNNMLTTIEAIYGTYKEQLWGCLASLNPGAGPAAAPRSPPRGNLRPRHSLPMDPGLVFHTGPLFDQLLQHNCFPQEIHRSFTDSFVGRICVFQP